MYNIIRYSLSVLIGIFACILIVKFTSANKRRWCILAMMVALILGELSCLLPVENAFISFPTPGKAFNYYQNKKADIVVEGKNSAFVQSSSDGEIGIMPRSSDGWKIGTFCDIKDFPVKVDDKVIVELFRYKNTDDYYIFVSNHMNKNYKIADNRNTQFKCFDKSPNEYFAYINKIDNQYRLIVDGEEIPIF